MSGFAKRMVRAARLDADLYEEVEADRDSLGQAMTVVVLASIAAGLGSPTTERGLVAVVITVGALLGWLIWAYLSYVIGARLLPEPQTQSNWGELLRTTGFATAPGLIRILGVIRPLAGIVFPIASIWMLLTMVIAVRQALDYTSTWRAIGVCAIGWLIQAAVIALVFAVAAPPP